MYNVAIAIYNCSNNYNNYCADWAKHSVIIIIMQNVGMTIKGEFFYN